MHVFAHEKSSRGLNFIQNLLQTHHSLGVHTAKQKNLYLVIKFINHHQPRNNQKSIQLTFWTRIHLKIWASKKFRTDL